MAHQCKNILIHCMDFRLTDNTRNWMEEKGIMNDCDVVSIAGAAKGIVDGGAEGEVILKQIELSEKLHASDTVILLHHSDCGAYRSAYNFDMKEQEKEKQMEDMEKVKSIIKEKFPKMEVKKIWAQMKDAEGKEVDFIEV